MVKPCIGALALSLLFELAAVLPAAGASNRPDADPYPAWRADAAHVLAARGDATSLATAAALMFVGPPSRSKADTARAASVALELAVKASDLAPNDAAIGWLRLRFCTDTPGCDFRNAATTMRWVAADNSAAWLPTLAVAQRDRDVTEIDRVILAMAQGANFDVYANRATVSIFDALKRARGELPANYLKSDSDRLNEAAGIATAAVLPSFSPLINACRESGAPAERRDACLKLSKILQRADVVMAQLVGFAIERRLTAADSKALRTIAERRHVLEWRVATATQAQVPSPHWRKASLTRLRVAKLRALPREEDVCIAILRAHHLPLYPPEGR